MLDPKLIEILTTGSDAALTEIGRASWRERV